MVCRASGCFERVFLTGSRALSDLIYMMIFQRSVFSCIGILMIFLILNPRTVFSQTASSAKSSDIGAKKTELGFWSKLLKPGQAACQEFFPATLQTSLRTACESADKKVRKNGIRLGLTDCRLVFGEEPRSLTACLIGSLISHSIYSKDEVLQKSLKAQQRLCTLHYPQHTDLDGYFQESCYTGMVFPELQKFSTLPESASTKNLQEKVKFCESFSPERSSIGPCTVGLALREQLESASEQLPPASEINMICDRYFDHRQFHLGYRSCLNSYGISLPTEIRKYDIKADCGLVISDTSSDNERTACIVGSLLRWKKDNPAASAPLAKRIDICGKETKVSYKERDFLACLTGASLLELMDRGQASSACKDLYKISKTNRSRTDCQNSLSLF
jgi:hypothetical protein